jgi:hypothetical protein
MTGPVRILVLGASYGLLPGVKLSLAGHAVTFVGRADEIGAMAREPICVEIPPRQGGEAIVLTAPVADRAGPARVALATPDAIDCAAFDFVLLAMQEPHYADPPVAALMAGIAAACLPCLSIMNMPPPPFLKRLEIDPSVAGFGVFRSGVVWNAFDPDKLTLASPDPQALRPDPATPGRLQVTLPSNFKAAPFAHASDQALLQRLASDLSHLKVELRGRAVRPPVALLAASSLFVPLAKWPMLIAGNCRCVLPEGMRTIAEAVLDDPAASAAIYEDVSDLVLALGAAPQDLVAFEAYARAAAELTRPSSLARALAAGATQVERVDLMIRNLMRLHDMDTPAIHSAVECIETWLARNRALQMV